MQDLLSRNWPHDDRCPDRHKFRRAVASTGDASRKPLPGLDLARVSLTSLAKPNREPQQRRLGGTGDGVETGKPG